MWKVESCGLPGWKINSPGTGVSPVLLPTGLDLEICFLGKPFSNQDLLSKIKPMPGSDGVDGELVRANPEQVEVKCEDPVEWGF